MRDLGLAAAVLLAINSACTAGTEEEVGAADKAATAITWTNIVGASAAGNDLSKTATGTGWNAGASSVETLVGDGYVEFGSGEATTDKMAGLGSGDTSQHHADIEFAIRLNASGGIAVFESGTQVLTGGTYAAGDRLRVQVLGGVVTYWKNGAVFYTSAAAPSFPLLVDTSLRTPGATITDVEIEDLRFWRSVRRARAVAGDLEKTDPGTSWNAGAVSIAMLPGDGFVQFTSAENTTDKVAGLASGNDGPGFADIDFGVFLRANGRFAVYEAGVNRGGFGRYVAGDVFRVQVVDGVVSYWKNGVLFYTSAVAPSFPLLLDTALRTPGATVRSARLVAGISEDRCLVQTQRITGDEVADGVFELGGSLAAAPGVMVAGFREPPPAAAVYSRVAGSWQLEQFLSSPDASYFYADSVATDGQTIAVSDPRDGTLGSLTGAVFLYRHDGQEWAQDGLLVGCAGEFQFGTAVDVEDDLVVVGKSDYDDASPSGRAYVFRRRAGGWARQAILTVAEGTPFDGFGQSVAIGGDRIFVAMPRRDTLGNNSGAVYVYRRGSTTVGDGTCNAPAPGPWQLEAILYASNAQANDWFGGSASGGGSAIASNASGTQVLIGNPQYGGFDQNGEDTPNGPGTVHQFTLTSQGWRETFKLDWTDDPSAPFSQAAHFGAYIALGGPDPAAPSFAVVGPKWEDAGWVYRDIGGGSWSLVGRVDDLNDRGDSLDHGVSVAATDDSAILGSPSWTDGVTANIGAVYDFDVLACPAP